MRKRVLGVLNGHDFPIEVLQSWAESADSIIAADGAALRLAPHLNHLTIIGDMDSLGSYKGEAEVISDLDQNTTDVDKLLAYATAQNFSAITLISIEGDRLDHMLATLNSCVRSSLEVRIILRRAIGYIVRAGNSKQPAGSRSQRCSFLPLSESIVDFEGVAWPLEQSRLSPDGPISISNRVVDTSPTLKIHTGVGLLIMETEGPPSPEWFNT